MKKLNKKSVTPPIRRPALAPYHTSTPFFKFSDLSPPLGEVIKIYSPPFLIKGKGRVKTMVWNHHKAAT